MMVGWFSGKNAWHFQRRLYQRFGLVLRWGEYSKIVIGLRKKEYPLLGYGKGNPVYCVTLRGIKVPVVMNDQGEPITAYWPSARWLRNAEEKDTDAHAG